MFFAFEICLDVVRRETRLLKRELRGARERRRRVGIESDVAEREDVDVLRQLQRWLHDQQSALVLLDVELFDQRDSSSRRQSIPLPQS